MNAPVPRDPLRWVRGLGAPASISGAAAVRTTLAFTDRGQVGIDPEKPYGTANLARHVGDDDESVDAARQRLAERLGVAGDHLLFVDQVHGTEVVEAVGPWLGPAPQADAVVTTRPGLALAVMVADCVPVLLADPLRGVVGVAHAGRVGLASGVVTSTIAALHDLGAEDLVAVVGPSICPRCYEVPADLRAEVSGRVPVTAARTRGGTPSLDLASGVMEQLSSHCSSVELAPGCTAEDPRLFSYRRDGLTGRFAGIAWMLPSEGPGVTDSTGLR